MSTSTSTSDDTQSRLSRASALPGVPGLPWWGAVSLAVIGTLVGGIVDKSGAATTLAWGFRIGFCVGVVLAVLLVRRRALFTALVQPPLVLVLVGVVLLYFVWGLPRSQVAFGLVELFPTMALGTGIVVVIAALRFLAQPMRGRATSGGVPVRR